MLRTVLFLWNRRLCGLVLHPVPIAGQATYSVQILGAFFICGSSPTNKPRRARYARFFGRTPHRNSVYRACRRRAKTYIFKETV
jgi:hypothetical protein